MMHWILGVFGCAVLLVSTSGVVEAQSSRPERPYRGLFGGGVGSAEQLLTFDMSFGAGYDDNVFAAEGLGDDPRRSRAGEFGNVSAGLNYSRTSTGWNFRAAIGGSGRYSPELNEDISPASQASVQLGADLWTGARLTLSQTASHQPYFVLHFAPVDAVDGQVGMFAGQEFAATRDDSWAFNTSLGVAQQLSRRGALGFSARQQVSHISGRADHVTRGGALRYTHAMGKGLGVRVGYGYQQGRFDADAQRRLGMHSIDAGLDFNRALSLTRRTFLSFSSGSTAVADANRLRYHLTGSANLRREIGRTWQASIGYDRSVRFVDVLEDAMVSDGASASLGGLLSQRLEFQSGAGVSFGHPAQAGGRSFDSYAGSLALKYALTRYVALGVTYSYYRYEFDDTAALPAGFSRRMDRQSVRAHLSLWAPLVHRARRPDAAR